MDDNGNAFPVLGHAAFWRNIDAQVASDHPAHWVVLYFSDFFCRMAVIALYLVSCKLKINVRRCTCVRMRTRPEFTWVLMETGTFFLNIVV